MKDLKPIISKFDITGTVNEVKPLGNGLINDTYKVTTVEDDAPDYVPPAHQRLYLHRCRSLAA